MRRREGHIRKLLLDRTGHADGLQPTRRTGAGRRLPLANLIAVNDEHVGAVASKLSRYGEPGKTCSADQDLGARALD